MPVLYNDTETFSTVDLFGAGLHAYAEQVEVMLWAYALDDGEIKVWDRTLDPEMPGDLAMALDDPAITMVWHNAQFDRTVIRHDHGTVVAPPLALDLDLKRTHCTMVRAMVHGLPGGLDKLCAILKVPTNEAKDKAGKQLIQLFCKPPAKNLKRGRATRLTHPVDWERFKDYAKTDISAMRVLYRKLPRWNWTPGNQWDETRLWRLDQKMNDRGVLMDLELADAAIAAVAEAKTISDERTREITDDTIETANQRDALLKYILEEHGVELPDMKASTLERRMYDETLPEEVRELLRIRLDVATTSTSKFRKLKKVVSPDGRARGLIQFSGALRTRRDGGRLWQPQNLMRPTMSQEAIEQGIDALKLGVADLVCSPVSIPKRKDLGGNSVTKLCANTMRGSIIASPGKRLVVSDLSNIEGVGAAYLAGEQWKLEAYRRIFMDTTGTVPDMYRLAYGRSFGVDPMSITVAQRQLGKIQELALAYEGGVGAFVTFVLTYRMDLAAVAAAVLPTLAPEVYKAALGMWEWRKRKHMTTYGLTQEIFIACEALKLLWREAHPQISSYWKELEKAFKLAMANPGDDIPCRKLTFRKDGSWVRMILPSSASVCYPSAHLEGDKIVYAGVNQYSRQWGRLHTYGGKLFENADQSFSRDVLFSRLEPIEDAGYDILMRVHDEVITEAPDNDNFNDKHLSGLLAVNSEWNEGLPLKAAGFTAYRYRKDD